MEAETDAGTPKLSLYSLPSKAKDPPWLLSPPLRMTASVPFEWEEAPGKPRACTTQMKPNSSRCLELPPRLLSEAKITNMPSPTTVLEGPDGGRSLSYGSSFRKGGSFRSLESLGKRGNKEKALFGSSRWGSFRKTNGGAVEGSFVFPSPIADDGDGGCRVNETQVKITRFRRKGSLLNLTNAGSHVWANIYESLKQVVPWRRGQDKVRKKGS